MSMNLNCKQVELIQTPTFVTYLCFYADYEKRKQGRWQDIREKYILYLRSWGNSSQDWEYVNKQIELLRSKKKLTFYIM